MKELGRLVALCLALALAPVQPVSAQAAGGERDRVSAVLDALHEAASIADFEGYFDLYAREAVFLGTDETERWTRSEFMDYARSRFSRGQGWTYEVTERHVFVAADGATAWFDERLENQTLGETRGTGVLVREDGRWKVVQYNLTIPIPNDLARDFVERIRAHARGG